MLLSVFLQQPVALIIYNGLGIFALELALHKGNTSIQLYLPLLYCILIAASELIAVGIVTLLFTVDFDSAVEFGTARAVGIVIAKFILIILLKLSRAIVKSKMDNFSVRELKLSLPLYVCPVISIALTHYVYTIDINYYDRFNVGTFLSLLAILYLNFIVFWYFDSIKAAFDLKLQNEAVEAKLEQQTQYYTLLEKHQKETIALRHDMRRHIALIKSLISDGHKTISEEYVNELEKQLKQNTPLIQTPHPVISVLLTWQNIKAQELGVDMRVSVNIISDIKVNPVDLCVLIGNVVDNAIEACEFLPAGADKYVAVKIAQRDSKLLIHVENPYVPGIKKANRDGKHGFGLKNVNKVMDKCGGLMDSAPENGQYKVRLIIP